MKKVRPFTLWGIIGVLVFLLIIQGITLRNEQAKNTEAPDVQSTTPVFAPSTPILPMTLQIADSAISEYLDDNLEMLVRNAVSKELEENMEQYVQSAVQSNFKDKIDCYIIGESQQNQQAPVQEPVYTSTDVEISFGDSLTDQAVKLYLSGDWNGFPTEMDGHSVTLSYEGRVYIDGQSKSAYVRSGTKHSIDLPEVMTDFINQQFILGDGTYRIEGNTLVKYSHGKQIPLSGGKLVWKGMDLENYRPYDVELYYDNVYDKLFIIASSIPYDFSNKELKAGASVYLYVVPDRSVSEIKFISEISNFASDEAGIFYSDVSGTIWRYYEKEGKYYVKKSQDPNLIITDIETIYDLQFSRTCAFADGYIHEKESFPEGTFTHPVVTTPSVSLSQYSD